MSDVHPFGEAGRVGAAAPRPGTPPAEAALDVPEDGGAIVRTGCEGGVLVLAFAPGVAPERIAEVSHNVHHASGLKVIAVADVAAVRAWHPHDPCPGCESLRRQCSELAGELGACKAGNDEYRQRLADLEAEMAEAGAVLAALAAEGLDPLSLYRTWDHVRFPDASPETADSNWDHGSARFLGAWEAVSGRATAAVAAVTVERDDARAERDGVMSVLERIRDVYRGARFPGWSHAGVTVHEILHREFGEDKADDGEGPDDPECE